jgi:O-antigen/teichoic acid export membrane protein
MTPEGAPAETVGPTLTELTTAQFADPGSASALAALSKQVKSGLGWGLVNTLGGKVISFATGIILARLLVPSQYGTYAIGLTAVTTLTNFNDLGIGVSLVRRPDIRSVGPTVVTITWITSLVFAIGCFLAAPDIASAMHNTAATVVIRALSACILIDGFTSVPSTIMMRHFMQRQRLLCDTVSGVTTSVVTVALAATHHGTISLAIGLIAGNALAAGLYTLLAPERFWPGLNTAELRPLFAFGLPLASAGLLYLCMLNTDYVIVSVTLGASQLGLYLIAFNLSSWPVALLSGPVRRVALAGFARLVASEEVLVRTFERTLVMLIAITLPACALLAILATPLIRWLYTLKFAPAAVALPGLMALAVARMLTDFGYDFMVAKGRVRLTLGLQATWLALLIPTLTIGAHLDRIRGVGIGHAILAIGVMTPLYVVMLGRLGVRFGRVIRDLRLPLAGVIALAVVAYAADRLLPDDPLRIFVGGAAGLAVYAVFVWPLRTFRLAMPETELAPPAPSEATSTS